MPPKVPPGQTLNKKDDEKFKTVMRLYESKNPKNVKKALKTVEEILVSNPDHGESIAMKGLILSLPPFKEKEKAYELVKQGVFKNFSSLVCWHVYGLLYRSDNNYVEAIKCYKQALRLDPNNMTILRDLSLLQLQARDLGSLADTRQTILQLKPQSKINWLLFAFAHHLQGNHECALCILDAVESSMGLPTVAYDVSEFYLYRILVTFEGGDYQGALDLFKKYEGKVVDDEYILATSAECYEKLGNNAKEIECYAKLVDINADCIDFVDAYVKAVAKDDAAKALDTYRQLREKYPKSQTVQHDLMLRSTGDEARKLLNEYIRHYIKKGIPSLGRSLKAFYDDAEKTAMIGEILAKCEGELNAEKKLADDAEPNLVAVVFVWTAQAYHYLRTGDCELALKKIDAAIAHTPTIEMLYLVKAKVLKKMGNLEEASEMVETCRKMDLGDRNPNTKSTKALFRVNKWKQAEETYNLFTYRPVHETWSTILDMQIQWYITAQADCLYRLGDLDMALQRYLLIDRIFKEIVEDQFDFHHYVSKKQSMRAYLDLLRFMDHARNHRFWCYAAKRVVRCYLDVHQLGKEQVLAKQNAEFREYEEARAKLLTKEQKEKDAEYDVTVDYEKPLEAAEPFLSTLLQYRGQELDTHLLAVELYTTMNKPLKALRSVKQALTLKDASKSAELKAVAEKFFASATDLKPVVKELVDEEKAAVMKQFS
eukprot:TRINITY_DN24627_c0_g1_i1.p1 TRINITY_DN24627_c0_g1~~TRINITY_DN24627_c0_g1_i1.p1  ORF type:complete len:711 (+),score=407.52 TRINITY_DN24627_c0_g1_i1:69-2201(+)